MNALTPAALRAALSDPGKRFPGEAVAWARDNAAQASPALLAMLSACAKPGDLTDREAVGGFYAGVLLAAMRETRAFPIFCALARNGDRLDEIFADFSEDYLHRMLVGIDGGDRDALLAVVKDRHADPVVRASFLRAWSWHAVQEGTGFQQAAMLSETLAGDGDPTLWHECAQTLIALDAEKALPLIETFHARMDVDDMPPDTIDYRADAAAWHEDPAGQRETYLIENAPIGDPVAVLEHWIDTLDRERDADDRKDDAPIHDEETEDDGAPIENPFRDVGRNDPCPCGSGRKFKKCCLPTLDAEPR